MKGKADFPTKLKKNLLYLGIGALLWGIWHIYTFFPSVVNENGNILEYVVSIQVFFTGILCLTSLIALKKETPWAHKLTKFTVLFSGISFTFLISLVATQMLGEEELMSDIIPILMMSILGIVWMVHIFIIVRKTLKGIDMMGSIDEESEIVEQVDTSDADENIQFPKSKIIKVATIVFVIQVLLLSLVGPVDMLIQYARQGSFDDNIKLISFNDHTPQTIENVPKTSAIVKVQSDNDGIILSEEYFTWSGSVAKITYENGSVRSESFRNTFVYVIAVVWLFGMLLIGIRNLNKNFLLYGATSCVSMMLVSMVRMIIGFALELS